MSSLPSLDAPPSSPAEQSASSSGSEKVLIPAPSPSSSSTDSSGGVGVRETSSPPPPPPPPPSSPPPPPPPPATADDLPSYAAHNPGPFRTLPRNLDVNDPLAGQFIRGIANLRRAMSEIDTVDVEHVRLLSRIDIPHLGGGIPAAREARRALRAAEQELGEAFEAALAVVQQNRTDADRLADLRALLEHLEGWIHDSEAQTRNYARRMERMVRDLRTTNAMLGQNNNQLHAALRERDAQIQRRTARIQYLEAEVAEMAGYN